MSIVTINATFQLLNIYRRHYKSRGDQCKQLANVNSFHFKARGDQCKQLTNVNSFHFKGGVRVQFQTKWIPSAIMKVLKVDQ